MLPRSGGEERGAVALGAWRGRASSAQSAVWPCGRVTATAQVLTKGRKGDDPAHRKILMRVFSQKTNRVFLFDNLLSDNIAQMIRKGLGRSVCGGSGRAGGVGEHGGGIGSGAIGGAAGDGGSGG